MKRYKLLIIDPGSTSTKIAVFENEDMFFDETIEHGKEDLKGFGDEFEQLEYREKAIAESLEKSHIALSDIDAVVGRGGGIPTESGTWLVNGKMLEDLLKTINGHHPANLGAFLADAFAKGSNVNAYVVDPPVVDEMEDIAKVTGITDLVRRSRFHALNQKEVARRAAQELGLEYEKSRFVVAHLGGGISIAAHKNGRVVDVTDSLHGDGPFAPTRSGDLAAGEVIVLCFSNRYTQKELLEKVTKNGGFVDHLGTNDARQVKTMIKEGDKHAELIYNAMIYQIGKEIAKYSAVLQGKIDAVILTGGMVFDNEIVEKLKEMIGYLGVVIVYPGEFEKEALAHGALRVLSGKEQAKIYIGIQDTSNFKEKISL